MALYERTEDVLRCCHGLALNKSELCSRLLKIALDHGIFTLIFLVQYVKKGSTELCPVAGAWKVHNSINAK